jgi:hypothetical protein
MVAIEIVHEDSRHAHPNRVGKVLVTSQQITFNEHLLSLVDVQIGQMAERQVIASDVVHVISQTLDVSPFLQVELLMREEHYLPVAVLAQHVEQVVKRSQTSEDDHMVLEMHNRHLVLEEVDEMLHTTVQLQVNFSGSVKGGTPLQLTLLFHMLSGDELIEETSYHSSAILLSAHSSADHAVVFGELLEEV